MSIVTVPPRLVFPAEFEAGPNRSIRLMRRQATSGLLFSNMDVCAGI
jgi:hypothetical protein